MHASPALSLLAALFGACMGSFLNVVAWRLPRQQSIVLPGSHCPCCGTPLDWFDNIPLLSWLALRGQCRHCGASIAIRYWLVELLSAGLWVAAVWATPSGLGPRPDTWLTLLSGWLLLSWLVPLVLIDLDYLWLPEPLCRIGLVLGLIGTAAIGFYQDADTGQALLLHHLLAAGLGLLGSEAVSAAGELLLGQPALGLGDAKLTALLGAWLGLSGVGLAVLLAVFSGAIFGLVARLCDRLKPGQPFPFGPFLALGGAAVWLLGNRFWLTWLPL